MKTVTMTYYAAGQTATAGNTIMYWNDMFPIQGNLYGKALAIWGIDWTVHCYANFPIVVPYIEVAISKGVQLSNTGWVFTSVNATPPMDYPNMLLFDNFWTLDGRGGRSWPDLFPHETEQRDRIFFNMLIDNGQSSSAINPSYRIEMTIHCEDLNNVKAQQG